MSVRLGQEVQEVPRKGGVAAASWVPGFSSEAAAVVTIKSAAPPITDGNREVYLVSWAPQVSDGVSCDSMACRARDRMKKKPFTAATVSSQPPGRRPFAAREMT